MPCYYPIHAFKGKSNDSDKIKIVFKRTDSWRGVQIDLPCGRCTGCRLERARQWAVRCMHEASLYKDNCFITLTYNDSNLPKDNSLDKSHFQLFMKRLRKFSGPGIRYFHCGEYGDKYARPHYHALLFNFDFKDRKIYSQKKSYNYYVSETLDKLWNKGFALIGDVTFESASYVARYIMKKVVGDKAESHYQGRNPEYVTMSRGSKKLGTGGIGKGWYDKYKSDVFPLDRVVVRGYASRPPRFYDNLLYREDRSTAELIKIQREKKNGSHFVTDVLSDGRVIFVSDSCDSRLRVKETVKLASINQLKRPLEEQI